MANSVAACLLAAALFGAAAPAAKHFLNSVGPFTAAGWLYLGAALAAFPLAMRARVPRRRPGRRQHLMLAGAIIAGGVVAPVLLMAGLSIAPAASVSLWLALEMPATAVLAWLWFGDHLGRRVLAAAGLATAAGLLLASPEGFRFAWAGLLVAAAAVAWGLDNNLTALVDGFSAARYTLLKGFTAGTVNLALGTIIEGFPAALALAAALVIGAIGYGGSLLFYVGASQRLGAVRAQVLFATAPLFGVALAWGALREPVGIVHLGAGALLAASVALILTERHAHRHAHAAVRHAHSHRHDDGHHAHDHPGLSPAVRHAHPHRHPPLVHVHAHDHDLHHHHAH